MKLKNVFLMACLCAGSIFFGTLKAEEILLQDLYEVSPMDNSKDEWTIGTRPGLTARVENNVVEVDFKKQVGNVEVIISRGDGLPFKKQNAFNPQSMTIDMNGAEAGRYLLEVYTDTEAVGGVFEVK